jgi:Raf kinase inhibitor-like YbhB/YbcL family protein
MESVTMSLFLVFVVVILGGIVPKFKLTSSAFDNGKPIPTKYASVYVSGGKNISLPLSWTGTPNETKSFALTVVDLHPIANNWVHWAVINIPGTVVSLPEGASRKHLPSGSKELYNSFGDLGYGGPGPPKGSGPHKYEITIFALNVDTLDLTLNASLNAFTKAIEGKVIGSAKVAGLYER